MVARSFAFAAHATGGSVIAGDPDTVWRGAAIDSRKVAGGELFFALVGERTDGHRFVAAALAAGAAGVVVHRDVEPVPGGVWLWAEDTYRALHALTRAVRQEAPRHLVAVTGSVGKTTTKEILAAFLAARFRVARSPGNLNNLYGFPLSLLAVPDDCEWMVAEMGMSTPGELGAVSRLGRPEVALFTNVRPAHLERFGDLRGIADAKAELLLGLEPGGSVVANADDPWVLRIAQGHPGRVVRFGTGRDADVRMVGLAARGGGRLGSRFELEAGGERQSVELPLHGLYNATNCLAAAAGAWLLGVSLEEIAARAVTLTPGPMRGVVERLGGDLTLVDDAYNANPEAVERALESAVALPGRRHLAVLGDMLELGPTAPELHRRVGERAATLGFDLVVGVGALARDLVEEARAQGAAVEWLATAADVAAWLPGAVRAGDVVLVKGSRGVGLEAACEALRRARREGG